MNRNLATLLLMLAVWGSSVVAVYADPNLMVVRVGDGSSALTNSATAVFLDEFESDGTPLSSTPLPIVASGPNQPVTLSGTATSEGGLALSADNAYVTMAGYAAAPGTAAVSSTTAAAVSRVVARVDVLKTIDSSTRFLTAFDQASIRSAVSADGTAFWAAGNGAGTTGGIQYITLGSSGGVQIAATPNNCRWVSIFNGQLYSTSGSMSFTNVFSVGTGTPTTGPQITTSLAGFPTSGASPYGFSFNAAGNVCYVADDRAIASGGGVQKWTFDGAVWSLAGTFTSGLTTGVRGLVVHYGGAAPRIYATTTQSSSNQIVRFDDTGSPTAVVVAAAPSNTAFRGIALSPGQSTVSVEPWRHVTGAARLAVAPNPCGNEVLVEYVMLVAGHVTMALYDPKGRLVETLADSERAAGHFTMPLDTAHLPAGIYFLRVRDGDSVTTTRLLKIR